MPVVKIVPAQIVNPQIPAAFLPSLKDAEPNQPLGVLSGDSIIWRNNTTLAHWPWPTDAQGNMLTEQQAKDAEVLLSSVDVPPGDVSDPIFLVNPKNNQTTIHYCCRHHPQERSSIVIQPTS
jgi:hypothetical protein